MGVAGNEDACVLSFPGGKALVQTVDFFTPIVDDAYAFGQIAAANALSDVYAMGGEPLCAMNIVCFPIKKMPRAILTDILRGGRDKVLEAGAVPAGGHSVEDDETKYGLAVSGVVDPDRVATNKGLLPGDRLILTKPLGTGVLSTALKAKWQGFERFEELLIAWASRLNATGGRVIRELGLRAATDVTGFGLGGHLLEMAHASNVSIALASADVPVIDEALDLAAMGLLPAGSHANRKFCASAVHVEPGVDGLRADLCFDAQTSGGLVLAVPEEKVPDALRMLAEAGEPAHVVGRVHAQGELPARLTLLR
ncbi:selenide, water dikinase [Alkalidesulfovibrio alkalitolerans DSM 16529]|uniref:Selenide, water dikinase n=1 Tax=Alkalidesulfovibrio alkalitolerans DSM 16529 TaxID=1121439 RepID=S7ULL8_9BACT|nr:selenide, water dikinase [Alkalidesulfovibrio alkalitolerans DSM 16529]